MNMAKKDIKRNPAAEKIADLILNNYDVQNAKDVNEALKDVFGPIFEKMLNAEMDAHLGYDKNSSAPKETENRRNGYGEKTIQGSFGETSISVPRDRDGSFKPVVVPKHQKDVSEIEGKVLAMYARGRAREISAQLFRISMVLNCHRIKSLLSRMLFLMT
jgi:transposase-like protein